MCEIGKCAKIRQNLFGGLWQNPELILINMFRITYVKNFVTLAWKMSSGRSKEAGSLNGPLCAYLMRQNLHDRTRPRYEGNKCPCQVWKWSTKIYRRESVNDDFPCAKLENAKKNRQNFFWRLWQNPELVLINMFRPTYVQNLVTLAWKMSSGRSKEAGSLNDRLCAYLMRQNFHDQTCPRP